MRRELNILLYLQDQSRGQSSNFIVQCFHRDLVSSNEGNILLDDDLKSPIIIPMVGLILECGGPNLRDFFKKHSHGDIDVIHRVHILRDIVNGLQFLHDHKVVHGDLKPENIVSFSFLKEGMMRWKIIDFDTSFIEGKNSNNLQNNFNNLRFTPEYSSPELLQNIINKKYNSNSNNNSTNLLNWRIDIWSLGLISIFIFKGCTLWKLLHPSQNFQVSMLEELNDNLLQSLLVSHQLGEKEKSFIEGCLKVNPMLRDNCNVLSM